MELRRSENIGGRRKGRNIAHAAIVDKFLEREMNTSLLGYVPDYDVLQRMHFSSNSEKCLAAYCLFTHIYM